MTSSPPVCTSIECQLLPSDEALRLESRLERRGYVCTGKARLSDSVVVDLDAGARLLPFDEAMGIGARAPAGCAATAVSHEPADRTPTTGSNA